MTHRILPPAEWPRLHGTSLGESWWRLPTTGVTIVVVEDEAGAIIGHTALFQAPHAEDWWIHPEHQKRGAVLRHLLMGVYHRVAELGDAQAFITAASTAEVAQMLEKLGAARLPGDAYTVPVIRS